MSKSGQDCWLTRVDKIEQLFSIPKNLKFTKTSGKNITARVKSIGRVQT